MGPSEPNIARWCLVLGLVTRAWARCVSQDEGEQTGRAALVGELRLWEPFRPHRQRGKVIALCSEAYLSAGGSSRFLKGLCQTLTLLAGCDREILASDHPSFLFSFKNDPFLESLHTRAVHFLYTWQGPGTP